MVKYSGLNVGKVIATSMFADPLHIGHLECLERAKELGDILIVLVDSDRKAVQKKGFVFMPQEERLKIIQSLKCVDYAFIVDTPISEALEVLKPNCFVKGGDRTIDNLPQDEIDVCKRNGIEIICGLGDKIQSSSNLIDNSCINKPWGKYIVLHKGLGYLTKRIIVEPNKRISLQYHYLRDEYWTISKGKATITLENNTFMLEKGLHLFIPKYKLHRVENMTNEDLEIIEVQIGVCDENDIVRLEDDFNRIEVSK